MLKNQPFAVIFLVILCNSMFCFGQLFDGTSLSSHKPYYGEPPYRYVGSEYYFITFNTDPEVVKALLPEPLKPVKGGEITIYFAHQKIVAPSPFNYNEVYFTIPVAYESKYGGYIPVLYLDKVAGILPGREIWGYNKVDADIQIEKKDSKVKITVSQLDTLLIKATFELGEPFTPPTQPSRSGIINHKYIPSVAKDVKPDVNQLTYSVSEDSEITQLQIGEAKVKFFTSFYNPLGKIPVNEVLNAGASLNNFTLVSGEVLHDYNTMK